jgi:hypothetical protein
MGFALFDQRRVAEALPWFRKAASTLSYREGSGEAMLFVGKLYLQGLDANPTRRRDRVAAQDRDPAVRPGTDTPIYDPAQPRRNTAVGEAARRRSC